MATRKPMRKPKVELEIEFGKAEDKKWQAKADMDTVMRAQEIMADRSRMAMVKKLAAQQAMMANKIAKK